ncbi:MAG: NAD(P)/FAD-dependent oxidoreductase [Proteobacteria bacterium]|nr:NAD(P)/FAD-dependent oxidoreductase [Pseudomonadota bacterium]MDA0992032.1 NAD(P)/FAD-dependent oxidoreductase [Pseudomonadota bacterium]
MIAEYVDVVIVGAGLSGIGAACHLSEKCPEKSYLIMESRDAMGGTWELFRYPGIRSDSDMHTLGYNFKPWLADKAIADGPSILKYINDAASEHSVNKHIRYGHKVTKASWSGKDATWTIEAETGRPGDFAVIRCGFIQMCSGYYNYESGYLPEFKGRERFHGDIIHPQHWPANLDYTGKRVVVIGSGATAMTLIPAMAEKAGHITMIQRSPTYVVSLPDTDWIANFLRKILPEKTAYAITRWKNIKYQEFVYRRSRTAPEKVKKHLLKMARKELGPDYDIDRHFTPNYGPWDQRLCLVPNSDLFLAIRSGKATVVTGEIEAFTENGVLMKSGDEHVADIVISATGLNLLVLGGTEFIVDGKTIDFPQTFSYKAMMYSDVPNMISTFGYINASWTLKADLTAEYACRLLSHMDETGMRQCTPRLRGKDRHMVARPWIENFSSGYIQRQMHVLPKQGDHEPWINTQDYRRDKKIIRDGEIDDGVLEFSNPVMQPGSANVESDAA